jgi:F-type H+-transporting ATPase subunit delta
MKQRHAAAPYAKALFELANERDQAELIGTELGRMVALYQGDAGLREFFNRPSLPPAAKRAAALEIAARSGLSKLAGDFLALVAERGRATHLAVMAEKYDRLLDDDLGRVRIRVRSAVALTSDERDRLTEKLSAQLHQRAVVEEVVDSSLLGGFIAENATSVVDGTLDGQLEAIRRQLAETTP